MSVNIKEHIAELLYKYEAVIIPEFGGFVSKYKSSHIDHVQGLIHPPSKTVSFNPNLVANDGILINCIKNKNNLDLIEAKNLLNNFVAKLKDKLDKREIILFPQIGRLYKDYENKLQFLQDSNNFNLDAYGLSAVQFHPIVRNNEKSVAEAPIPPIEHTASTASVPKGKKGGPFLQKAMPYLFVLALLVLTIAVYTLLRGSLGSNEIQKVPVSETRINTKPSFEFEESSSIDVDEHFGTAVVDDTGDIGISSFSSKDQNLDTEASTLAPNQKECVVIVGGFRSKDNVRQLIERIYEAGFDAYKDQKGSITRVGVQFFYETQEKLDDNLSIIRDKFEEKAWILKE